MKMLDKLKNALFEEEYVEVEEKPKKKKLPKEQKKDKKKERIEDEPIAKKIVLPERNEIKISSFDEKDEEEQEKVKEEKSFPIIDDNEFVVEEPKQEISIDPEDEVIKVVSSNRRESRMEQLEENVSYQPKEKVYEEPHYEYPKEEKHHAKLYGMDEMPIPSPEYGTYEKDDRTYFKPSPIISPIYGILDKNYKKEEVSPKREIRITSSFSRENIDVDDVRRKAYGNLSTDLEDEMDQAEEESNLMDQNLVDLSDEEKPEIKKVTIADAEEYFNDLGLEYNVDYKDKQKESTNPVGEVVEEESSEEEYIAPVVDKEEYEAKLRQEQEENDSIDEDDNLFDLIDSMYEKE